MTRDDSRVTRLDTDRAPGARAEALHEVRSQRDDLFRTVAELNVQQDQGSQRELRGRIAASTKKIMKTLDEIRSHFDTQAREADVLFWQTHRRNIWGIGGVSTIAVVLSVLIMLLLPRSVVGPVRSVIAGLRHSSGTTINAVNNLSDASH